MSKYSLRPAMKSAAKLLFGIYSPSGCGKTYSALLLARGFVGPAGKIVMIESESGRGEIYADSIPGGYDVISMHGDYSPKATGEAIAEAEAQKADALIIDSASHEWEGVGGVLDMAAKNEASGKKGPLVWQQPKIQHEREFVQRMMRTPIPLVVVCMRAKYPMEQKKNPNGTKGDWQRSSELSPKQSEDILFEMMAHGWIDESHFFHVTKYPAADKSFAGIIVDGKPLSIETGQRLATWSKSRGKAPAIVDHSAPDDAQPEFVSEQQIAEIQNARDAGGITIARLCKAAKVETISQIKAADFERAMAWIAAAVTAMAPGETFASVADKINKSKNLDELAIAADLIRTIADVKAREDLDREFARRREELTAQ